ncbi:MAG: hypothetical protein KAR54_02495 [Candidatus Pacebacteria bacterium]|nr:hypothetical protein [Candidatus Paceibacterota bacterium]
MDSEEKQMLKESLKTIKENRQILNKIKKGMLWGRISRIIYWVIIVGISLGAYYYVQPFVDSARETVHQIQSGASSLTEGVTETTDTFFEIFNFSKNFQNQ